MKTTLKVDDRTVYEFSDQEEFKGHIFLSIKKVTTYNNNKKYQVLTIKPEHWEKFQSWIVMEVAGRPSEQPSGDQGADVPF